MWAMRLAIICVGVWGGSFGFILAMHNLIPDPFRGLISAILLMILLVEVLYEWLQKRQKSSLMARQYHIGRWHWLIHERNGDPSAPRVIALLLLFFAVGYTVVAQFAGVIDLTTLFN